MNKEEKASYDHKRYIEKKESILLKKKNYRDSHKDEIKEYSKVYYDKNGEKLKDYQKNLRFAQTEDHRESERSRLHNYWVDNKEHVRSIKRAYLYGISKEEYEELKTSQHESCKICNTHFSDTPRGLLVDHDHITGKVRGLLCHNCNTALGLFKDSINSLEGAINYLKEYNGKII